MSPVTKSLSQCGPLLRPRLQSAYAWRSQSVPENLAAALMRLSGRDGGEPPQSTCGRERLGLGQVPLTAPRCPKPRRAPGSGREGQLLYAAGAILRFYRVVF
jgi:hypothetical protein